MRYTVPQTRAIARRAAGYTAAHFMQLHPEDEMPTQEIIDGVESVMLDFENERDASERSHLLTLGSPVHGLCLRVTLGRLDRSGRWHSWQPCAFLIWRGRRL